VLGKGAAERLDLTPAGYLRAKKRHLQKPEVREDQTNLLRENSANI